MHEQYTIWFDQCYCSQVTGYITGYQGDDGIHRYFIHNGQASDLMISFELLLIYMRL